MKILNIVM